MLCISKERSLLSIMIMIFRNGNNMISSTSNTHETAAQSPISISQTTSKMMLWKVIPIRPFLTGILAKLNQASSLAEKSVIMMKNGAKNGLKFAARKLL